MASDNMSVAALGRPFTLGMLYDASKDQLVPGLTWSDKTLQENTVESSQHSSVFQISASDSIESKSTLLNIDASLKASFVSGLIQVRGSASYLNDTKKFHNQSRVTLQYKATTNFKQLSMVNLATKNTQQTGVIEKGSTTHVVTGILYGASAFFVFDSEKVDASSVQDIKGSMEAVINKFPTFVDVNGNVNIQLTDEEKALTETFSCKFFGDFILKSNPATFVDAVKTYVELPKLLGESGENSVPVKVWLRPLKNLVPKAVVLVREISDGLVRKAEDALESIKKICMRCNDSLDDSVIENFPQMKEMLSRFQKLCNEYAAHLQHTMGKNLPSIRKREKEEIEFEKVYKDKDQSPFSHEKLGKWMDHKEREINIIRSCVEMMEGAKIVPNQSELDREVLAPDVEEALCFAFTSLESADPYLDEMAKYLDSLTLEPISECTNEDQWYYSDKVLIKMREDAKAFQDLAKALKNNSRFCFLIAAIENKKHTGATIYHYREGILVTDDFLTLPPVEKITDRRDLLWYSRDLTLDPDTANNYLTLSEGNKKATYGAPQSYPDLPQRFDLPQVLCKEGLTGRCYWEVEWSTGFIECVAVGVSYKGLSRKGDDNQCRIGFNSMSWCLSLTRTIFNATLTACHDSQSDSIPFPANDCTRVGVYLDWPAGSLSFYDVSADTLSHLHTFRNKFTEPVYPGFYNNGLNNSVFLCL